MRLFWIIIGVLAVAAAALVFATGGDDDAMSDENGQQAALTPAADEEGSANPAADATRQATAGQRSDTGKVDESEAAALVDDLLDSSSDQKPRDSIDEALDNQPVTDSAFDPDHPVDGKYIVAGSGTSDDPYQITWELLLLAAETYQPRYGKADIPPRIEAIDGKHIRIDGYFAFPLASTDARELLFMLNMWDGCCIGMPPSPYDAIEVRLKDPMAGAGRKQWVNYGTLTGTIKVDPYVQEGWLLGMYLMEDGTVDVGM